MLGVVLGFILGVTSVGSGALIGLALILVFRLTPHRVVGTDVFHAAVLLWAAGLAHVIAGNVDYGLMGNILVGSILARRLANGWRAACPRPACGPRSGARCSRPRSASASKAGLDLPALAIVGPPIVMGFAAYALDRHRRRRARERLAPASQAA